MAAADEDRGFSSEQRSGLQTHQADQDRTLEAMHHLEAALSEAAPGREASWRESVLGTLSVLEAATDEEGNTEHGNDERIRIDEVRRGPRILFDVVARVAGE